MKAPSERRLPSPGGAYVYEVHWVPSIPPSRQARLNHDDSLLTGPAAP